MKPSQKLLLNIFKIAFFTHFILLFFFCVPDQFVPTFIDDLSKRYAYPLFQARWNLFAPDPPKEHKEIRFKYCSNGAWSEWQDPVSAIENAHNKTRIGAPTKLFHVIQNGSHYLWDDYYKHKGDSIQLSFGFQTMSHLISKMHPEISMDSLQLRLVLESPKNFEDNKAGEIRYLEFPSIAISNE